MKCAIMQPTFDPWPGYFDMIDSVDTFVFLDDVQLAKRSWQVRNRIRSADGEQFVSVPVQKSAHRDELRIMDARIADSGWRGKLVHTLEHAYRKAPCYGTVHGFITDLINHPAELLADFNIHIIESVCRATGIATPLLRSSTLAGISGHKDERLASICAAVGAAHYLAAAGSAGYIEAGQPGGVFPRRHIRLTYQQYTPAVYPQLHGEFIPGLGIFDLLYNAGFADAASVIRAGRGPELDYMEYRDRHGLPGAPGQGGESPPA